MPDSFFQSDKKRKRPRQNDRSDRHGQGNGSSSSSKSQSSFYRPSVYGKGTNSRGHSNPKGQSRNRDKDEELSSESEADGPNGGGRGGAGIDDMDLQAGRRDEDYMSDEGALDEYETAAEKRVRLARGYLDKVRKEVEDANDDLDYDAAEIDREIIASRLQKDVAEAEGKIHTFLAPTLASRSTNSRNQSLNQTLFRTRLLSLPSHAPTAIALTPGDIYVSTKRGAVFRYSLGSLKRVGSVFGQAIVPGSSAAKGKGKSLSRQNGQTNGVGKKGNGSANSGASAKGKINGYEEPAQGHKGEILCIDASEDGRYVVTGGIDRLVGVWKTDGDQGAVEWVAGMRGHKDAVTGISIPPLNNPSHHILTTSLSRHLALQSLSTLSTIDTFFGHQDSISDVSSLKPTLAVTAGSRDRTCRWWKVEEEVQLVLRGGGRSFWNGSEEKTKEAAALDVPATLPNGQVNGDEEDGKRNDQDKPKKRKKTGGSEFVEGSIDVVCMLDDQRFISGGDSGTISLWTTAKKKPIFSISFAHGVSLPPSTAGAGAGAGEEEAPKVTKESLKTASSTVTDSGMVPRWITSLASLRGTDLFASGSWDGRIRIWALDSSFRSFHPVTTIPVDGFVNSLRLLSVPSKSIVGGTFGEVHATLDGAGATTTRHVENDQNEEGEEEEEEKEEKEEKGTAKTGPEAEAETGQSIVLAAAVSQEPRLGRWMRVKEGVKNGVLVAKLDL